MCLISAANSKALLCVLSALPTRGIPLVLFEDGENCQLKYSGLFTAAGCIDALEPLLQADLVTQHPDGSLDVHSMVQHSSRALLQPGPESGALDTLGALFKEKFVEGSRHSTQCHRTLIR